MECGVICYLKGCEVCKLCMNEYITLFCINLVLLKFPKLE